MDKSPTTPEAGVLNTVVWHGHLAQVGADFKVTLIEDAANDIYLLDSEITHKYKDPANITYLRMQYNYASFSALVETGKITEELVRHYLRAVSDAGKILNVSSH